MVKKNPLKSSLIFTSIMAALLALSYYVLAPKHSDNESALEQAKLLFPKLERQDLIEFSIESKEQGKLLFQRRAENNEEWTVSLDQVTVGTNKHQIQSFDGDKSTIDGIISSILAAKKEDSLQNKDPKDFGLDHPKFKLNVLSSKGKKAVELNIGNDTPVDYFVYAKTTDNPEIFLTSRSLRFSLDKKIADLRNRKIFKKPELDDLETIEIRTASTEQSPSQNLRLKKDPAGQWTSTVGGTEVLLETKEVKAFIDRLAKISVKGFVSENPVDRPKFGMNAPVAGVTFKIKGRVAPQVWVLSRARTWVEKQSKDLYYLALKEQDSTYEAAETLIDTFKVSLSDFRKKDLPSPNPDKIAKMNVTDANGKTYTLTKEDGSKWMLQAQGLEAAVEAKKELVEIFMAGILNMKALEFKDGASAISTSFNRPTRKVEILDSGGQVLEIYTFGRRYKEDQYYVGTQSGSSPAIVRLNIEELLPLDINVLRKDPPPTKDKAGQDQHSSGGKKVKLEATVTDKKDIKKLPAAIVKEGHRYTAEMHLSNGKKLVITFNPKEAPYTVSNFLHLARNGFYNDVVFHRVIPDFVVQGGDPTGTGRGGPGFMFDNEDNALKHVKGALSMAHAGRNTNGSQFFIVLKPQPHLDGVHTVFAQVTSGIEFIDGIKQGDKMTKVEVFEEAL